MSLKKEWVLTQEAFDGLLASLDDDREQAARKYERVRQKLLKFFEWRGSALPDGEADETINRVARKIAEGADVYNLDAYFYGVARLVHAESLKERERQREALTLAPPPAAPEEEDPSASARRACLDACLGRLPAESRHLIIEYYQGERGRKIELRKRLAARLGIPLNALRIRAHRIRVGLEACTSKCVGGEA